MKVLLPSDFTSLESTIIHEINYNSIAKCLFFWYNQNLRSQRVFLWKHWFKSYCIHSFQGFSKASIESTAWPFVTKYRDASSSKNAQVISMLFLMIIILTRNSVLFLIIILTRISMLFLIGRMDCIIHISLQLKRKTCRK